MAIFDNPFDPNSSANAGGCNCGRHASQAAHDADHDRDTPPQLAPAAAAEDTRYRNVVAAAAMRAVFPHAATRRAFLQTVGASTAAAALAQFFPLGTATEAFAA